MPEETKNEGSLLINVKPEDPLKAMSPVYSNFLAVSRVAGEVQFEFVFLDLNVIANILESVGKEKAEENEEKKLIYSGKTVSKVVMPADSFLQVKEHLLKIFDAIEKRSQITKEQTYDKLRSSG